jgi:hypothetical protein
MLPICDNKHKYAHIKNMKYLLICISLSTGFLYAQKQVTECLLPFRRRRACPGGKKKIDFFFWPTVWTNPRDYSVDIAGYCDFVDDDDVNNQLSLTRARHVENILLGKWHPGC